MANSFLEPNGLYDPSKRFAFTNITDEDLISLWAKIPIKVKAHETIEIGPATPIIGVGHALAIKMTNELVDKIIMNEAKLDELKHPNEPYYRSNIALTAGVPAARKVYEDKILRELEVGEDSPAIQAMRSQLKEEILSGGELNREKPVPPPSKVEEFAQLKRVAEPTPEKAPAKVKKLRAKKNETIKPSPTSAT